MRGSLMFHHKLSSESMCHLLSIATGMKHLTELCLDFIFKTHVQTASSQQQVLTMPFLVPLSSVLTQTKSGYDRSSPDLLIPCSLDSSPLYPAVWLRLVGTLLKRTPTMVPNFLVFSYSCIHSSHKRFLKTY